MFEISLQQQNTHNIHNIPKYHKHPPTPLEYRKISQTYQSCTQQNNYIILSCFNEFIKMLEKYSERPTMKQQMKCDDHTRAVDITYWFFCILFYFWPSEHGKQLLVVDLIQ